MILPLQLSHQRIVEQSAYTEKFRLVSSEMYRIGQKYSPDSRFRINVQRRSRKAGVAVGAVCKQISAG